MEKYLIALDMDGTLLNNKKKISFKTLHYLRKLTKQGHIIILASGRPSRALLSYYKQLGLSTPLICYNGAYCYSPIDKNFPTEEFEFPKEIIKKLYEELRPISKNFMCETDTEIWLDKEDLNLARFFWYEGMEMHYGDISTTLTKDPMTFIVQTPSEVKDRKQIEDIVYKYDGVEPMFWTGANYFELHFKKISKGSSLRRIAEYYHVSPTNMIAFGDSDNDFELFQFVKTSVAMKNSRSYVKEKATMVSLKDNNHNGIYHTLKKLLH